MRQLSNEQLGKYLNDLFDCNAFELHMHTNTIYIPYIMNDALECYLLLENARITGEYLKDFKGNISAEFIQTSSSQGIVFRQGLENVFTLWFQNCYQVTNYYRYDQIGHFWRSGAEQWRRLVYIIGTIYDKYEYMGTDACTSEEMELLPLMEFAPFRSYSPINESLDGHYADTLEGLNTAQALLEESGCVSLLRLLKLYRKIPCLFLKNMLVRDLNAPTSIPFYELLCRKIEMASSFYPERFYNPTENENIKAERTRITSELISHGFHGSYPLFHKDTMQIYVVEEHPFTILDWEHYSFRTQFMVSEADKPCEHLHYGFFDKPGNVGRIETSIDFLN